MAKGKRQKAKGKRLLVHGRIYGCSFSALDSLVRNAISSAAFCERFRDMIAARASRALCFSDTTGTYNFIKSVAM